MRSVICFCFALLLSQSYCAQEINFPDSKMAVVVLKNYNQIIGEVLENSDTKIILLIRGKEKRMFFKNELRFFKVLNEHDTVIRGKYMFPSQAITGYFLTSNAMTLGKRKLSLNGSYFLYTDAQYSISENVDLGFGSIFGAPLTTTFKAKYSPGTNLHIGVKAYASWLSYFEPSNGLFAGQALITNGSPEKNITIGPGFGVIRADGDNMGILFSTFGLKSRISQKLTLIGEGLFGKQTQSQAQFLGVFSAMGGLQHMGKRAIMSYGIGVMGYQFISFNFWGIPNADDELFPLIYFGYRKTFSFKK